MSVAVVSKITGSAFVVRGSERTALTPGAELNVSDTVVTEADAKVELRFADDTTIDLGPSTEVALEDFAFDPTGATEPAFVLNMLEGVVRSVSGKVVEQNPEAFELQSPMGVVGIRGTTTMHFILAESEVHIVESMDKNHIVQVTTQDGRTITLSSSATGVTITAGELAPLTMQEFSPESIQEYLNLWLDDGLVSENTHSLQSVELSSLIVGLAEIFISGQSDIDPLDASSALIASLGGDDAELDPFSPTTGPEIEDELGTPLLVDPLAPGDSAPESPAFTELFGTAGNDTLPGDAAANWIYGYDGNDLLYGGAGDDFLWGGAGTDQLFGGYGSFDILVKGSLAAGDVMSGDGTNDTDDVLPDGLRGDDDTIIVGSAPEGYNAPLDPADSGDMTDGDIYGDAETMGAGTVGGDDTIIVQGDMSGGEICGDAYNGMPGAVGGNDTILVQGDMSGGWILGDMLEYDPAEVVGGNNVITVVGTMSGDARISGGTGDDVISVGAMSGGVIETSSGNDVIHIGTADTAAFGEIELFRDPDNLIPDSSADSKTVQIDTLKWGGNVLQITCGDGSDTITISDMDTNGNIYANGLRINFDYFDGAYDTLDLRELNASDHWRVGLGIESANNRQVNIYSELSGEESISVSFAINGENLSDTAILI